MGNTDSMPVVSQAKSGFQALTGDLEGANETQKNFLNTCVVFSQGKSFYHWCCGDNEAARDTQMKFLGNVSNIADGIPVVGHTKGAVHYIVGDKEGGDNAMKSASRTVGVIGGGVVGGLLGGPVGAVAGGIAGGATLDGITTVADSTVNGEHRPAGLVATVEKVIVKDITSGEVFDASVGLVFDGLTGYTAGDVANRIRAQRNNIRVYRTAPEAEVQQAVKTGKLPTKGPHGEVWVTESLDHPKSYVEGRPYTNPAVMEIEIPKQVYEQLKENSIDQHGSRAVQNARAAQGQGPANLINTERLGANPNGQVNMGIKGSNIQFVNEHITQISEISTETWTVEGQGGITTTQGISAGGACHHQMEEEEDTEDSTDEKKNQ